MSLQINPKDIFLSAVLDPDLVQRPAVSACENVLIAVGLPTETYAWATRALASILYIRPELVGGSTLDALSTRLATHHLPPEECRLIGEVLTFPHPVGPFLSR